MSISLEEARRKLDILEKITNNPELVLTELFTEGVSGSNFLYQIKVKDKYILDYLKDHLSTLQVFSYCKISNSGYEITITVNPLRIGEYSKYIGNDNILRIDADKRTFKILNKDILKYEKVMEEKYELEKKELPEFWNKFKDLTLKKRACNSLKSLVSNKMLHIRLYDFVMWYFVSNKKIKNKLNEVIEQLNETNDYNLKRYNEQIEQQNYYREHAPKHIEFIKYKQKEISDYLLSIGYKEDLEMYDY